MHEVISNNDKLCADALVALHDVIDPEIGLNIVDLGLVNQVDFGENEVFVSMTLTTQFCPMGDSIRDATMRALELTFPNQKIHVSLVFDPPWNSSRISEEGRKLLNR